MSCKGCLDLRKKKIKCQKGESLQLLVEFAKNGRSYVIPRNVSCTVHQNREIINIRSVPFLNSIEARWEVTKCSSYGYCPKKNAFIVLYLDSEDYNSDVIITNNMKYTFYNLKEKMPYRICAAAININWLTSLYTCTEHFTDFSISGPVKNVRVGRGRAFQRVKWEKPDFENNVVNEYIFNIRDSNGVCVTRMSKVLNHKGGYNCSNNITIQPVYSESISLYDLLHYTNYSIEIYPISGNRSSNNVVTRFRTPEGASSPVLSPQMVLFSDWISIYYVKPSMINGVLRGYEIKVIRRGMRKLCAQVNNANAYNGYPSMFSYPQRVTDETIYEYFVTSTSHDIPTYLFVKCAYYKFEITPINGFKNMNKLQSVNGIDYRHIPGTTYNIKSLDAKFISSNMIQISFNDTKNDCDHPGYIFEVSDPLNVTNCVTLVIYYEICDELKTTLLTKSNCSKRQYQLHMDVDGVVNLWSEFVLSVRYQIRIWTILNSEIFLDPLSPIFLMHEKLKTISLNVTRLFDIPFAANETVSLTRRINGTLKMICDTCQLQENINLSCTIGKISHLVIELKRFNETFSLPFNVSCGDEDPPNIVRDLRIKYGINSISLSWNVSRKGEYRYAIYYTDKETSLLRHVTTSGQSNVISGVTESRYHQICISTIDHRWRTSRYACSRRSEYPTPVENITASSTNKEIYVSWKISRDSEEVNDGYIVNVTDPSGRCLTTVINMKRHCVHVTYSCPFPRIIRWDTLKTFVTEHLVPDTNYIVSISAISLNVVGPIRTVLVSTEKEGSVSNLQVSRIGSFVTVKFSAPSVTESVRMKYRVKVTVTSAHLCTHQYKTIYDSIINTTFKVVHIQGRSSNKKYVVEVTPLKECNKTKRVERTTSIVYKAYTRDPKPLININVTLLSTNLLKVYWDNIIKEDEGDTFGFIVESVDISNRSDCRTWIITRRTCSGLIDKVAENSLCHEKVYLRVDKGVIRRKFHLHGQFKVAKTYGVKIWIISDQVDLILERRVKYDNISECFSDCYDTGYTGIRTGTVDGNICLPWKNFTRVVKAENSRSNICHMKNNPSNIPWCINDHKGNLISCDIPKCSTNNIKCTPSIVVAPSKTALTVEWPVSVRPNENIRGYITLLHNTEHECEKYHVQACHNCIQLLRMSIQTQSLFLSCKSGAVTNDWSHKTKFDGLGPNREYFLYVIPLMDESTAAEGRNITVGTLIADRITPFSIQTSGRGETFLHFLWTSYRNVTTEGSVEYYSVTLVNSRSNKQSSIRSDQAIAEFSHLDICTEYCLFLVIEDADFQDKICTDTLAPRPGSVTVNDITSLHSTNVSVSWRYSGNDGCSKLYRVQYSIKFLKEIFERTTDGTSMVMVGLMKNVFYRVRVRAEMRVGHGELANNGEFSEIREFFNGRESPFISGVSQHLDSSKKTLDITWSLPGDSKGSLFEFVIRVTQRVNKCSESVNLICNNCVDPQKRKYLSSESIAQWEKLLKCERAQVENFKNDTKFFGNTINSLQTMEQSTLTIYGLNLLGVRQLYEKIL